MKDLTLFIRTELKPRMYNYIPQLFPQLDFVRKGNKYISGYHFDGTEGTGKREDRCVITEKHPHSIFDNSRQEAKDVITAFMDLNNITEVCEAVNRICDVIGIAKPSYDEKSRDNYIKAEQRRNAFEASLERQKKALFSSEGKQVLDYMLSRGWTIEEIKEAEIGYISAKEARKIDAQISVGSDYILSIPIRSGSTLVSFKFRTFKEVKDPRDKYKYLLGAEKSGYLFNLIGVKKDSHSIVAVEGELDALHATLRGKDIKDFPNFVATGGGGLTDAFLDTALDRGVKFITLLFDKDKRGTKFTIETIERIHKRRMNVLVATYPDEVLKDGTKVHDVDEYLQLHTAEDLKKLIGNATSGSIFLVKETIDKFANENEDSVQGDVKEGLLREEIIKIANHTPNEVERELVINTYANLVSIDGKQAFSADALRRVADRERAEEDKVTQSRETDKAIREILELQKIGDVKAILQKMEEASRELSNIDKQSKYSDLLLLPTEESFISRMRKKKDGITTNYILRKGNDTELFSIPSGAITFICAPTSHGKSTFLQNLTLQVADAPGEGDILYFTFEEDQDKVIMQMLNKYVNTELCKNTNPRYSNNISAIEYYYINGDDKYIKEPLRPIFHNKRNEFMSKYYGSGKVRIYFKDYYSEELVEAIQSVCNQKKIKAVFIDYIQLLYSQQDKRLQRYEELKLIANKLKNLAINEDIPIVVGAQLNREVKSPLDLFSQNISDASDLEKVANKILCLWNSDFDSRMADKNSKELIEWTTRTNIELGKGGKIYAKLTKNRGSVVGLEAVLNYNGNTGVISNKEDENSQRELHSPLAINSPY